MAIDWAPCVAADDSEPIIAEESVLSSLIKVSLRLPSHGLIAYAVRFHRDYMCERPPLLSAAASLWSSPSSTRPVPIAICARTCIS